MGRPRIPYWVWAVLVGAHAGALAWVLTTGYWNFPDSGRYLQAAENLRLHGELYARPWLVGGGHGWAVQEFTIRTVGYPVVVLGLLRPWLLLGLQNLLSLFNIGIVLRWWAQRARPQGRDWAMALAGVLLFPAQLIYANAVMAEMLLQTVVLMLAAAALQFIETGALRYFAGMAVAVVVGLLLKPVFCLLAVIFAVAGVVLAWRRGHMPLAWLGLVPVVVVGLYMGWNKHRTGYFHYSSITDINLLHYNAAGVVRQLVGPVAEEQWVTQVLQEADAQPEFAARQHLIQVRAGAVLVAHPVLYARQHLQGMGALLLDPGRFDVSQFLGQEGKGAPGLLAQARAGGLMRAVGRLPLAMLTLLGAVLLANAMRLRLAVRGFRRLKKDGQSLRYGRWVAVGLLLYVALLTGPLGAARFLVPVWPLLLGLALAGLRWRYVPGGLGPEQASPVGENQRQG